MQQSATVAFLQSSILQFSMLEGRTAPVKMEARSCCIMIVTTKLLPLTWTIEWKIMYSYMSFLVSDSTLLVLVCWGMQPHLHPQGLEAHWQRHIKTQTHTHTLTHIHSLVHGATWTSLHQRYICFLCMFDGTGRQRLATVPSYSTD